MIYWGRWLVQKKPPVTWPNLDSTRDLRFFNYRGIWGMHDSPIWPVTLFWRMTRRFDQLRYCVWWFNCFGWMALYLPCTDVINFSTSSTDFHLIFTHFILYLNIIMHWHQMQQTRKTQETFIPWKMYKFGCVECDRKICPVNSMQTHQLLCLMLIIYD